jgi:hypothetical protein
MKFLKKIDWSAVFLGLFFSFFGGVVYLALISQPPSVAGTLVCHAEGQMTAALQTTDGRYLGDGVWLLKHDKSNTYTRYVKANDEACVFIPGENVTTPQPPAPPKTTADVPSKGSNAS